MRAESENPFLNSRRTWNSHVGGVVSALRVWQLIALISLLITLASVGGIIYIGSKSKFIPYVVEVDKLGKAMAVAPVKPMNSVDPQIIKAALASFINNSRLVTPDSFMQGKAIRHVYTMLAEGDPATNQMSEWLRKDDPFERAQDEIVEITITSVLPETDQTWQVNWQEVVRDRQGSLVGSPINMTALISIYQKNDGLVSEEEELLSNPLGIYVKTFSWSKEI
jgi:type IV secretion system protein TrbF